MKLLLPMALACVSCFGGMITQTSGGGASILDNTTVNVDIVFADARLISGNLTVAINSFTHTWMGDLSATLTHVDTATTISLFDRPGRPATGAGCSDDFNGTYTFSDAGTQTVGAACTASASAILPPGVYLASAANGTTSGQAVVLGSAFNGEMAGGTWRLSITDNAAGDTGAFANWTLNADVSDVPEPGTMALLAGGLGLLGLYRRRRG